MTFWQQEKLLKINFLPRCLRNSEQMYEPDLLEKREFENKFE